MPARLDTMTAERRAPRRPCLVAAALLAAAAARADDVLRVAATTVDRPTLHALGVQVLVTDDDDRDGRVEMRIREVGGAWRQAPPLFRVRPETVTGRVVPEQFAGSAFDLVPGTAYEIELRALDADGPVDQTTTVMASTRPVPMVDPPNPRVRPVATASELRAAFNTAQPGDVIVLANGTYAGTFFALVASGLPGDPIVIRGATRDGVILDGGGCLGCNVLEVYGSHVHVEDLTIQGAERALRFQGMGATDCVVRRVLIRDVIHGIGSRAGQQDFTICDNVVLGRLAWPLVYTDDGGIHADDQGIRVEGSGHVVCHNTIRGFGDPLLNFEDGARSWDVYGNDIADTYGDGVELDRGEGNVRCWGNRFTNVFTAISLQPIHGGPAYVLRNVASNVADEQLKLHSLGGVIEPSGVLVHHNTFVSPDLALNCQTSITQHAFDVSNNLFVGPDVTERGFTVDWTADVDGGRFDRNGYWPDGRFWFGSEPAGPFRLYASFALAQASGVVEGNGTLLARPFFASGLEAPATFRTTVPQPDARPARSSPAVDAGEMLPGINAGFGGNGPDMGALEGGCDFPVYGPRLATMDDRATRVDCLASVTVDVYRSDAIASLGPPAPDVAGAVAAMRVGAAYLPAAVPPVLDPDPTVGADPTRPLVLYELADPFYVLRVSRTPAGLVELDW
jgi:hypothetical protein